MLYCCYEEAGLGLKLEVKLQATVQ
jgi:hypothetical protein